MPKTLPEHPNVWLSANGVWLRRCGHCGKTVAHRGNIGHSFAYKSALENRGCRFCMGQRCREAQRASPRTYKKRNEELQTNLRTVAFNCGKCQRLVTRKTFNDVEETFYACSCGFTSTYKI